MKRGDIADKPIAYFTYAIVMRIRTQYRCRSGSAVDAFVALTEIRYEIAS